MEGEVGRESDREREREGGCQGEKSTHGLTNLPRHTGSLQTPCPAAIHSCSHLCHAKTCNYLEETTIYFNTE